MLGFEFFDARFGDAFLVRWGSSTPQRTMLVDGGPTGVYEASLRKALQRALPPDQDGIPHIDVLCLSHIHDDHAAGLVRLLTEMNRARNDQDPEPFSVDRLWFNSVEELVETRQPGLAASVHSLFEVAQSSAVMTADYNQGRDVRNLAPKLDLAGNKPFGGQLVQGDKATVNGLKVTVVAPDEAALEKLADEWRLAKQRRDPGVITAAYDDGSIPNLSSIVLHVKHGGHTALLTGDARGDRILAGLKASGLLEPPDPLHVNLLKLQHHGSVRNMEPEFFQKIHADHYVASADGVKHHHPSEETLEAIVESRQDDDEFTVHLTNEIAFAVDKLRALQDGRRFKINVRTTKPSVAIKL